LYLESRVTKAVAACTEKNKNSEKAIVLSMVGNAEAAPIIVGQPGGFDLSTAKPVTNLYSTEFPRIRTQDDLYTALRNADAAGNSQAARKLADLVRLAKANNVTENIEQGLGLSDGEILASLGGKTARPVTTFTMRGADGKHYSINGPAGATKEQAASILQRYLGFICDPDELYEISIRPDAKIPSDGPGQVLQAFTIKRSAQYSEIWYGLAFFVVLFGAIPAVWYFFLRRLNEIGASLRGK